jgi:hypothetical protein
MSKFLKLEADAPATLGAVVEAVTRLSAYPEADLLDLVSTGKISDVFPFRPNRPMDLGSDSIEEDELIEASAIPLSPEHHAALIQSSLPSSSPTPGRRPARPRRPTKKAYSKR